jgi:hypothetical protein
MPLQEPSPQTPWQATLLPASFRGVPFAVEDETLAQIALPPIRALALAGELIEAAFTEVERAKAC